MKRNSGIAALRAGEDENNFVVSRRDACRAVKRTRGAGGEEESRQEENLKPAALLSLWG